MKKIKYNFFKKKRLFEIKNHKIILLFVFVFVFVFTVVIIFIPIFTITTLVSSLLFLFFSQQMDRAVCLI